MQKKEEEKNRYIKKFLTSILDIRKHTRSRGFCFIVPRVLLKHRATIFNGEILDRHEITTPRIIIWG